MNIDLFYFSLALFIGLFIIYATADPPTIVLEYPPKKEHFMNTENGATYEYQYDVVCESD